MSDKSQCKTGAHGQLKVLCSTLFSEVDAYTSDPVRCRKKIDKWLSVLCNVAGVLKSKYIYLFFQQKGNILPVSLKKKIKLCIDHLKKKKKELHLCDISENVSYKNFNHTL